MQRGTVQHRALIEGARECNPGHAIEWCFVKRDQLIRWRWHGGDWPAARCSFARVVDELDGEQISIAGRARRDVISPAGPRKFGAVNIPKWDCGSDTVPPCRRAGNNWRQVERQGFSIFAGTRYKEADSGCTGDVDERKTQ